MNGASHEDLELLRHFWVSVWRKKSEQNVQRLKELSASFYTIYLEQLLSSTDLVLPIKKINYLKGISLILIGVIKQNTLETQEFQKTWKRLHRLQKNTDLEGY